MFSLTFQALLACSALWIFSRLYTTLYVKSDIGSIPGPKRSSFFSGNMKQFFAPNSWDWHAKNSEIYGRVMRLWGPLGSKMVYISDPLALHYILVKEAYSYEEPRWLLETLRITLGNGLLSVTGDHHKKQRKLLTPVFSTKHMKLMIPMFYDIGHKVRAAISKQVADGPQEVDMLLWVSRTALELVGVAGLGYSFESFEENAKPSAYTKAVKALQPILTELSVYQRLLHLTRGLLPDWIKRRVVEMIPSRRLKKMTEIVDVMDSTSTQVYREKLRALDAGDEATVQQIGEGRDIISILIKANREAAPEDRLPEDEVLGQMSTLISAAFDTTSSALARIIHLLSHHQDVQDRLRAEISEAMHNGDISFEDLVNLPYLEAVCRETLRLYSPAPHLSRESLQDGVIPLSTPITSTDGKEMNAIHVPKGTNIILSLMGCNRDKLIWGDDALEWKPDRWLKPLPESVLAARIPGVYANLMTFSAGGRSCIGFKFSQLEMKVVMALFMQTFVFEPAENKEIEFNMAGVIWSKVVGGPGKPELPVKVSLVKA